MLKNHFRITSGLTTPLPSKAAPRTTNPVQAQSTQPSLQIVVFLLAHIPLALLMRQIPQLATLHALGVFLIGFRWAISKDKMERVAYVGAYLTGSEVLWRMTQAQVFWEYGKYATATIFMVAIVQLLRLGRLKFPVLPLFYFALLLPSAFLTFADLELAEARQRVSFNLSGPFALMVGVWFFSHLKLSTNQLQRVFMTLLGPLIGVAAIAFMGIHTASDIEFGTASNKLTSGGFSPNQVSAVLGLGVLLAFLYAQIPKTTPLLKAIMFVLIFLFGAQSAMTFSRTGLYLAGSGLVLASFYLFRDPRKLIQLISGMVLLVLITNFLILPRLDAFTQGALSARFHETDATGRDKIGSMDLQIWTMHPLLGVGPGRATSYRAQLGYTNIAHTEFTRLLSEHGSLGLAALLLLLIMAMQGLMRAQTITGKALLVSMTCWSFCFMLVSGMRLVAPSFIFGLTFVFLVPEENRAVVADFQGSSEQRRPRIL
ncbi:MAG: O-antigen ligase family protein [Anaerolineae bacterium]|nr:O-antigen ligase family protein [Anaerolineae bacterium]